MTLGNKIAHYRKNLNITQDTLAQQLGVTNQAVSKWEADHCCPDVMLLPKLADIFSTTIDALFGRDVQSKTSSPALPWPDDNVLRVAVYVGSNMVCGGDTKPNYEYIYEGDVDTILSCISVRCRDVMGNVNAGLNVSCGNVMGHVDAGTTANCGKVYGNVDAGTDVTCGDVSGNVDAGCNVTCGNVAGNVDAGCIVECSNVEGDIDAGGPVTIRK